jgi:putative membrane protein
MAPTVAAGPVSPTGSRQVADGTARLAAATPRLASGVADASAGADRLADGAGQLASGQRAWRVALGGWLAPVLLGAAQAVVAYLVVVPGVGIGVSHPLRVVGFMVVVSATFMAIIHALMARFGTVGQFLALVLMVVQLVSAGGTFPWQTLPAPLHPLHHALPMSYAVDGLRRLMYCGATGRVGLDVAVLVAWGAGALVVGALAARRAGTWTALRIKPEVA